MENNPALLEVVRVGGDGEVLANAHRDASLLADLFTIRQSSWFQQAMAGAPFTSNLEISALNEPYLIMAIPAARGGIVAARLRADVLWDVVDRLTFGTTGRAYLVNGQGRIIAYPDRQVVISWTSLRGRPEREEMLRSPAGGWSGSYVNLSGARVQGVAAAIPGTDWIVVTELSEAEASAASRAALLFLNGGILLFVALLAAVAARRMRRVIFRPMEQLSAGAERIGAGDLDYRIPVNRSDEVGDVAEAFNAMAVRLKGREGELAAQAAALKAEVLERERTAEGLKIAKEEAEAASRAKSQFLANMSHEIRTPMNGIIGMNELILTTPLTAEQRRFAETIRHSSEALLSILNDILDFSKIEAGKLRLEAVDFDLRREMRQVEDLFADLARQKGLAFTCDIDAGLPAALRGDPVRLRLFRPNIVGNPDTFPSRGGVALHLALGDSGAGAATVRFEVRDTGVGVPPGAQTGIFDSFTQADGSTTRRFGGTGLGLTISRQLVELMGGAIGVESRPGAGSTFWFTARFEPAHEAGRQEAVQVASQPRRSVKARVLLAEDNRVNQEVVAGMLAVFGVSTEAVGNGRAAVEAWRSGEFDLVFMDCQMPEMDGYEAARNIREEEGRGAHGGRRTPIVALTAHALEGDRELSLAAGMDDHLSKPFRMNQLEAVLKRWLKAFEEPAAAALAPAALGCPQVCAEPDASVGKGDS
jgi:signal transduction histidine kinase/CheY-like chemotaxis protein